MAGKGSSGGAKKAAAKAKAAASNRQKSHKKPSPPAKRARAPMGDGAHDAPVEEAQPTPRKRPDRRNEEDAAERAIKLKLLDHGYDPELVRTARNANGETIHDLVAREIAALRGRSKYLTTSFWVAIHSDFDLRRAVFKDLPEVPDEHEFEPELTDSLAMAHSSNPAERTSEAFVRYLELAAAPSKWDLVGMLHACLEGPTVGKRQSHSMKLAILKFIGRHSLWTLWPELWEALRRPCEALSKHGVAQGYR